METSTSPRGPISALFRMQSVSLPCMAHGPYYLKSSISWTLPPPSHVSICCVPVHGAGSRHVVFPDCLVASARREYCDARAPPPLSGTSETKTTESSSMLAECRLTNRRLINTNNTACLHASHFFQSTSGLFSLRLAEMDVTPQNEHAPGPQLCGDRVTDDHKVPVVVITVGKGWNTELTPMKSYKQIVRKGNFSPS